MYFILIRTSGLQNEWFLIGWLRIKFLILKWSRKNTYRTIIDEIRLSKLTYKKYEYIEPRDVLLKKESPILI